MNFLVKDTYRLIASVTFDFAIWTLLTLELMTFQFINCEDTFTANIFVLASNLKGLIKDIHQILRERSELCVGGIAFGTEC